MFFLNNSIVQQSNSIVKVLGCINDGGTGIDLDTRIFAIINSEKVDLGSSKGKRLDLNISTHTTKLIFETSGYKTLEIPVFFHGPFQKETLIFLGRQTFKGNGEIFDNTIVLKPIILPLTEKSERKSAVFYRRNQNEFGERFGASIINSRCYYFNCDLVIESFTPTTFRAVVFDESNRLQVRSELNKIDFELMAGTNIIDMNLYEENLNSVFFANKEDFSEKEDNIFFNQSRYSSVRASMI